MRFVSAFENRKLGSDFIAGLTSLSVGVVEHTQASTFHVATRCLTIHVIFVCFIECESNALSFHVF